jgi:hypothetical protein
VATGGGKVTSDASNLFVPDRVFQVLGEDKLSSRNAVVTGAIGRGFDGTGSGISVYGFLDLYNTDISRDTVDYFGGGIDILERPIFIDLNGDGAIG